MRFKRIGCYNVTALIGEGGMGQVYQATDTKLNRQVALKIIAEAPEDRDHSAGFHPHSAESTLFITMIVSSS